MGGVPSHLDSQVDHNETYLLWQRLFGNLPLLRDTFNSYIIPDSDRVPLLDHQSVPFSDAHLLGHGLKSPQKKLCEVLYNACFEFLVGSREHNSIAEFLGSHAPREPQNVAHIGVPAPLADYDLAKANRRRLSLFLFRTRLPRPYGRRYRQPNVRSFFLAQVLSAANPTANFVRNLSPQIPLFKDDAAFRDHIMDLYASSKGCFAHMIESCPLAFRNGNICRQPFRYGAHEPRCTATGCKNRTHHALVWALCDVIRSAGATVFVDETPIGPNNKRIELRMPASNGLRHCFIDVTVVDASNPSSLRIGASDAKPIAEGDFSPHNRVGTYAVFNNVEREKRNHYRDLIQDRGFVVAAVTARGNISPSFHLFLRQLAHHAMQAKGTPISNFLQFARRRIVTTVLTQRWISTRTYRNRLPAELRNLLRRPPRH